MIRNYNSNDAKAIRSIAYNDAARGSMRAVSAIKCNYYIENEPEHCFVMTDEFDNPTGYILCAVDLRQLNALMPSYLAIVKEEDRRLYRAEKRLQKKLADVSGEYPARLSISVLPSFRGKGGAKALVTTLLAHLKEIGVRGVYTVADSESAVAFCERLGFERIARLNKTAGVFGIKIQLD